MHERQNCIVSDIKNDLSSKKNMKQKNHRRFCHPYIFSKGKKKHKMTRKI